MAQNEVETARHDTLVEVINFLERTMFGRLNFNEVEALLEGEFADYLVPALADLDLPDL